MTIVMLAPAACHTRVPPARASPEVAASLRANGEAAVMVALAAPADAADSVSAASYRTAIARLQDEVIAAVDSADFRVRVRFASVPALAGVVRTERGLQQLLAHRFVLRVSLDEGGTGRSARPPADTTSPAWAPSRVVVTPRPRAHGRSLQPFTQRGSVR